MDIEITALITMPKGSWRWQDAFSIATYEPKQLVNGKLVWISQGNIGKFSLPQLRRASYQWDRKGSQHYVPLTREEVSAYIDED